MAGPDQRPEILFVLPDRFVVEECSQQIQDIPGVRFSQIHTGQEFVEQFDRIKSSPPAIIVGDLNMPGMHPSPEMPKLPAEIEQGCFDQPNTVGLRILKMLAFDPVTKHVPQLLVTYWPEEVLERSAELVGIAYPGHFYKIDFGDLEGFNRQFRLTVLSRMRPEAIASLR